jgi:hypothetical protein
MQIMLIIEGAFAVVCALVVIIYFSQVSVPSVAPGHHQRSQLWQAATQHGAT